MTGFLPFSRGTFMLDTIASGLIVFVPLLAYSIFKVRVQKDYETHRKLQTGLSTLLAVLVIAFEIELRLFGWRQYSEVSPYYDTWLPKILAVHLTFAISTTFLWLATFTHAFKKISKPAKPNSSSNLHKLLGRATVVGTCLTGITGWCFYYSAFMA